MPGVNVLKACDSGDTCGDAYGRGVPAWDDEVAPAGVGPGVGYPDSPAFRPDEKAGKMADNLGSWTVVRVCSIVAKARGWRAGS